MVSYVFVLVGFIFVGLSQVLRRSVQRIRIGFGLVRGLSVAFLIVEPLVADSKIGNFVDLVALQCAWRRDYMADPR